MNIKNVSKILKTGKNSTQNALVLFHKFISIKALL